MINKDIFKAYDIRGIVTKDLTAENVELIGKSIGTFSISCNERNIVVGYDGRISSPTLADSLIKGLISTGCYVINIGMVATPTLYYATKTTSATSAVMITGSHNPPSYNGFKIIIADNTLTAKEINNLFNIITNASFATGAGVVTKANIIDEYLLAIVKNIKLKNKLKIVVDCGNGVAGIIAPKIYRAMGLEVIELFCNVDGSFPNHHPDPSKKSNLFDIIKKVKEVKADIGFAFDGDGDRLGVIDCNGNIIYPDVQMMLFSKDILSRHKNAKIIFDVKCSSNLTKYIKQYNGKAIMSRTGHSFIKAKIKQENAVLGGEMSGHIFFNDNWYGFDDAMYAGARLLKILNNNNKTSAEIFAPLVNKFSTSEIVINLKKPGEQFIIIDKLKKNINFTNAKITLIDGIRVDYDDCWGLIRASNTTPSLVLRFEGLDKASFNNIKQQFKEWLTLNNIEIKDIW